MTKNYLKKLAAIAASLVVAMGISSCSKPNDIFDWEKEFGHLSWDGSTSSEPEDDGSAEGTSDPGAEVTVPESSDLIGNFSASKTLKITWSGSSVNISGSADGVTASSSEGNVIITSTSDKKICYELSGSGNGSFKLTAAKPSEIILNGLTLTSDDGPAINIQSGKRVFIFTKEGTTSTLTDSATHSNTEEDQKGAIFSEGQLTFCGSGTLKVAGKFKHGICSDDYIIAESGNVIITESVSDGVHAKDYFIMQDGKWNITSTGEGIDVGEGNLCINGGEITCNTSGDKSHGLSSFGNLRVNAGKITSKVSGKGSKCLKTDSHLIIADGVFSLTTTGDVFVENNDATSSACIKVDGNAEFLGGTFTMASSGQAGKGINVDGTLVFGQEGTDGPTMSISTSGSAYGTSGGQGGFHWGGPGGSSSETDSSKPKAVKAEGAITVNSGDLTITTSKSEAEGIESKNNIVFNGGKVYIKAYDDAINSSYNITINGGYIYAYSTGNDAIDSNAGTNGAVRVNGGVLIAATSKGGAEMGIDIDGKGVEVNGGYIFTIGGNQGMSSNSYSTSSTQASAFLSGLSLSSGKYVHLYDGDKLLFSMKVPFSINNCYSLISAQGYKSGTKCEIKTGSSAPTGFQEGWKEHDVYLGGAATGTTSLKSFTFSSIFYTNASSGPGGRP